MAAGTKIIFEFLNSSGSTVRHSYNYGNSEVPASSVRAYMNAAIANNSIFRNPPSAISKALIQVTTETAIDLSD